MGLRLSRRALAESRRPAVAAIERLDFEPVSR